MKKKLFIAFLILISVLLAIVVYKKYPDWKEQYHDFKTLSSHNYDSVFLSMYPIDNYNEADYSHYRAFNVVKSSHCISNFHTLQRYMTLVAKSGNTISTIYIGVYPEKIPVDKFFALLAQYPSVHFEIVPAYHTLDTWTQMDNAVYQDTIKAYYDYAAASIANPNVNFYSFFASEWLISNSLNYTNGLLLNDNIARKVMLLTDTTNGYQITPDNLTSAFENFHTLITASVDTPVSYPDLSDWDIVFFGDSVIGNFQDSTSIPNVVSSLTGANCYNCAIGGTPATDGEEETLTLNDMLIYFQEKQVPQFSQTDFTNTEILRYYENSSPARKLCFVINYGLNDYYSGAPISSDDPYDPFYFSGAFRNAIKQLQTNYPDCKIILLAPNFTTYFSNGTEKMSTLGGTLSDYVNTIESISQEYSLLFQNNYEVLGINADNHLQYLADGCHPNETGRFLFGSKLALKCHELLQ